MSYEARVAAAADIYISRTPVHAQDSDGNQLWTRKQIARAFLAGNAAVIGDDTPSSPAQMVVTPADQIIGQIEELFPNWRSYRDLVDCITCELHELRKRAEGRL